MTNVKKSLAAAVAVALISLGWGGLPAQAGPNDGYPGVVQPEVHLKLPKKAKAGHRVKATASITIASNGNPCRGKFMLKATPRAGGDSLFKKLKDTNGGSKTFEFRIGKRGTYVVKLRFIPSYRNPCKGAHTEKSIKIT